MIRILLTLFIFTQINFTLLGQYETINNNKFKQLKYELATPNVYRNAAGAPGHEYYQQKADYDIKIELNDNNQSIVGSETITYTNNSPDNLEYLWLQLDQNVRAKDSDTKKIQTMELGKRMEFSQLKKLLNDFDGGFKLDEVKSSSGNDLKFTVNKTMMRIDLEKPLKSKASVSLKIKWHYNINDRMQIGGRSGYEYFEEDSNYLYTIAQFYPRMAVYNDVEGWQNKQFLGRGEFAVPFGDYKVSITVPSDHIVGATGVLQNQSQVLTAKQQARFKKAKTAKEPVLIVNQEEAEEVESKRAKGKKTWVFEAENVRDFGFASSRKFIWDAVGVKFGDRTVMAMSYYPKEGNPLWERYSTKAVVHTLKTYSKFTFDYPYPTAISVNAKWIGMEYPMICFNFGRPEKDGTYSEKTKNGMIGVIIHEVGHNFFPMIVNSDERQWTWMDEGLNTFLQYLTEREWDTNFPSRRGPAYKIVDYMKGDKSKISPIMTNSESIFQFGNNAYGKPATALNILRETVLGRELFDFSFKTYAQRWMFKHPTPADFFRTMEDASATDLDWFWRGWFYSTDNVDISIDNVDVFEINTKNPEIEKALSKQSDKSNDEKFITNIRNQKAIPKTFVEEDEKLQDFYFKNNPYETTILDEESYASYLENLNDEEKALLNSGMNFYQIQFSNKGGIPMPIILEFEFEDATKEKIHIPAEIWKMNQQTVNKVFPFKKSVKNITLDPNLETADVDVSNNSWPPQQQPTRFELFKRQETKRWEEGGENGMQRDARAKKRLQEIEEESNK